MPQRKHSYQVRLQAARAALNLHFLVSNQTTCGQDAIEQGKSIRFLFIQMVAGLP